jgi:plastocyanin
MLAGRFKTLTLAIPAAVLLMGATAACGDDDDEDNGNGTQEPTGQTTATVDNGNGDDGEPITITMTDNVFEPKDITVPVDTEVEITVVNEGAAVHNMHVLSEAEEGEDFMSDALVNPGAESTFTVEFENTGTYDFQCDFHLPDMSGTITVQ